MTTPYDVILRQQRRELDEMRVLIGTETGLLLTVEASCAAMDAAIALENEVAAGDCALSGYAYAVHSRARRAVLDDDRRRIGTRLDGLRGAAVNAYGTLNAIEEASARYRANAARIIAVAENSQADDLTASRMIRDRPAAKWRTD